MNFPGVRSLFTDRTKTAVRQALRPSQLIAVLMGGAVVGLVEVVLSLSLVALIFSGDLSPFLANGVGLALLATVVTITIIGLFSSMPGVAGGNQDISAAILAVIAASLADSLAGATAAEKFLTVTAVIGITTVLTGVFFWALGHFRLGRLVRFLPYPVVGGFLAGTGWLLTTGAIGMMTRLPFGMPVFQPDRLLYWLPGLAFALIVFFVMRRVGQSWVLPIALTSGALLFYAGAFVSGASLETLSSQGWLLGPFPQGGLWPSLSLADLGQVQWAVIAPHGFNIAAILGMSAVALLLNSTGLELAAQQEIDMNHDLKVAGAANMAAGLFGGLVGFHQLSVSLMSQKMRRGSRLVVLVGAGVCVLALIFGASLLAVFPRVILGGLLLLLGISLLHEWVAASWSRLPRADYFVVILILLVTATVGFLEAVVVGLITAVIFFVIDYSRVDIVRHQLSGATQQSRVTRPLHHQQLLTHLGETICILRLQGFVFFGTADGLINAVRAQLSQPHQPPLSYLIFDFRRVTGIDSTASLSFNRLQRLADQHGFALIFTELSPALQQQMEQNDLANICTFLVFPDLDRGLAWCEENLLAAQTSAAAVPPELTRQLRLIVPDADGIAALVAYCQRREIPTGHYLIHQNDPPDTLYFVESGQVTALLDYPDDDQGPIRLQTMRGGHVIGELGFYLQQKRTAAVIADEPSVVYALTREILDEMEKEDPESASLLHRLIIRVMAARVTHLVTVVDALQR